jgi:glycosyltransferase involved in cell wall biosynthesis
MVNNAKEQPEFRGTTKQRPTAVCIIVENLPVPLDRRVWREAAALRDAGYSVSVICPKGKGSCTASHEVLEGIHIYRHAMWEPSSALGYLLEYALALVGEFYLSLKVFALTRFRILQGCNPPDTIFLIGLFFKLFGVRYIFDHHDLSPELFEVKFGRKRGLLPAMTRAAELCSFKVAEVAIACNESFREVAVTRGGKKPERVFVVRNCPDLTTFRRRSPQPETRLRESFQVAYVGFMAKQDGLPLLVESIEHMVKNQNRQDTHFLLVGGGSELLELRGMVAAKELNSYVTFTGQVSHEDVAAFLADSDVGVAPDPKNPLNDSSTMIQILEYMAFGLPVVLFDLKEGRRVAGPAALYALPNDPVDFANQINRLLDSPELRRRLGECGRARIEEGLNWETEKQGLLRAYRMALEPDHAS